ncbi:cytochrome P450 [Jackrogersella minutella]|nr:cytochrome P450 [Jackrogersella minutella]
MASASTYDRFLESLTLTPVLIVAVILGIIVNDLVQYVRLRQFKGPTTTGFSRLWLLRAMRGGNMHKIYQDVNTKYGKIARIGPKTLLVSDVELIRKINAPRSAYQRSDWYKGGRFVPNEDTLLSLVDDNEHKALRAKMTPGFNISKENERVESSIDSQVTIMLDLIKSKYISSLASGEYKPMDWGYMASYFGIDSITDIAFSEALGDLKEDQDKHRFLHNMEENLPMMSFFTAYNEFLTLLQSRIVVKLLAPSPNDPSPFGQVMGFARKCARERFGPQKVERRDMLGAFLRHGMDMGEAERGGLLQLVAGSDTVATALRAAVLWIATNPLVVNRMRAEMEAAGVSRDRPTTDIISGAKARSIKYLVAVIRESLRMHPPVVGGLEKQLVREVEDQLPDGRKIPIGTKINVSTWAILRDTDTFGEDAEVFRPERWLEDLSEDRRRKMDRAQELVFSAGRFICMGREIAMTQCLKVISELFYRFDITVANPEKPWHSVSYGIFCQHDQWVRVTERDSSVMVAA